MRARGNRRKAAPRRLELPRISVNWRLLLVPPGLVALAILAVTAGRAVLDRPVTKLTIEGEFERVTAPQIEAALAEDLGKGLFSLDLDEVTRRLEALDWVDTVSLGRRWPDRLIVSVTEHTAAARWGEDGLLNVRGELFAHDAQYPFPELPRLNGPEGSERELAAYYLRLRGKLAEAQMTLDQLSMDERGALSLKLATGQEIRFGREEIDTRISRFFDVIAPAITTRFDQIKYVDLRYTNGFAVGWTEQPDTDYAASTELRSRG